MIRAEIVVSPCEIKGFSARICLMRNATKGYKKTTFFSQSRAFLIPQICDLIFAEG
jgi:hypothetical protein